MEPGVLFDIDGVLTVSWEAVPGAGEAVAGLRRAGYPVGLVTNTSSRSRRSICDRLARVGIDVDPPTVFTAVAVAAAHLARHHPGQRCLFLNSGDVGSDLGDVELVDPAGGGPAEVVLLGGAGPEVGWPELNHAFRLVEGGAALVALHRTLRWQTADGPNLDMGAFLTGLEAATGVEATVVGKPAPAFFLSSLEAIGAQPGSGVMVGDDVVADVLGAQAVGLTGVAVRTGKFTEGALRAAPGRPDHVVDSVRDVPALIDRVLGPPRSGPPGGG